MAIGGLTPPYHRIAYGDYVSRDKTYVASDCRPKVTSGVRSALPYDDCMYLVKEWRRALHPVSVKTLPPKSPEAYEPEHAMVVAVAP